MSRPLLLASVADLAEARLALRLGADIVDLKDPARGALGAWPEDRLRRAVDELGGRVPLSAVTGDLPPEPTLLLAAARRVAATGVDYVKVGLFAGAGGPAAAIAALGRLAHAGVRLVAVLMADQPLPPAIVGRIAAAGFTGVMLDTADKAGGSLLDHRRCDELSGFIAEARALGLLTGLAGSLRVDQIAGLSALEPDYLGFRGALCRDSERGAALDPERFEAVAQAVVAARKAATATAGKQAAIAAGDAPALGTRSAAAR